jgi:HAE1 family hydrophobic/amphiphilic exporter-1
MTLAGLFESPTLPFLVLLAVPMALCGVFALFWRTDTVLDSSALIGLVLLFGIVVNNAILLVNRFRLQVRALVEEGRYPAWLVPPRKRLGGQDLWRLQRLARQGLLRDALAGGLRIQLRSILLTSGTTVVGLLPLLLRLDEAAAGPDIWHSLALAAIGGLVSSTILIVIAMPALYWTGVHVGWAVLRLWARRGGAAAGPAGRGRSRTDPAPGQALS